ncbi:hypothetical protein BJ741DRAFT_191099 [Chytriomyces cf. hyalinus JEL632]|nr:hypothetical protein BJ741DRAFT_191099 [Chytriomyces cf. hyalinus JEL632]
MSRLHSALVFVIALSAVAIVATAAARFVSPAKTPKKADARTSKRASSRKTRVLPQESQVTRSNEAAKAVYLPCPVFIRSDPIACFKIISISEVPVYIPVPIFQWVQRHELSHNDTEQALDECAKILRPAGLKQQAHEAKLSVIQSASDSVKVLYSLDQNDVAEYLKTQALRITVGPAHIREIPYAAAFITPESTPLHDTTSKTGAIKEKNNDHLVSQNLVTSQRLGVSYSVDKYEVGELPKFTDVRFASGPNHIRQIAYGFSDVQQKAISTEAVVNTIAAPTAVPQETRFTLSRHETETSWTIVSGPFGIRQIPFGTENVAVRSETIVVQNAWKIAPLYSKEVSLPEQTPIFPAAVPVMKYQPVVSTAPGKSTDEPMFAGICKLNTAEKTFKTKMQEKKLEKKAEKKVEKKAEKKVEKKAEKKVEKKAEKKVEKKVEKKEGTKGEKSIATEAVVTKAVTPKMSRLNPYVAEWEPLSAESANEKGTSSKGLNPYAAEWEPSGVRSANEKGTSSKGLNPYAAEWEPSGVRSANEKGTSSKGLNPYAAEWEPSGVRSANEKCTSSKGLNPFAPTFQPVAVDDGYERLNGGLNQMRGHQYLNMIEKVAVSAVNAILPNFKARSPVVVSTEKTSLVCKFYPNCTRGRECPYSHV